MKDKYSICETGSVLIQTNGCLPNNTYWYADSTKTIQLYVGQAYQTATYSNLSTQNQSHFYYVTCKNNTTESQLKKVEVVVSPKVNNAIVSDIILPCNTFYIYINNQHVSGCSSIERPMWYSHFELFPSLTGKGVGLDYWESSLSNWSNDQPNRNYYVACENIESGCSSEVKQFSLIYDCTPPAPPVVTLNSSASTQNEKGNTSQNTISSTNLYEYCVGETVNLEANNCISGTVFWEDGFVGNLRSYKIKKGHSIVYAYCKANNLSKSDVSNSLEFNSKPTPIFTLRDTLISTSSVNLLSDTVYTFRNLPDGTTFGYYSNAELTSVLQDPNNIVANGKYYIKATSPNTCFSTDSIVVMIDKCGKIISLYSPVSDYSSGIINEKSREKITLKNKFINSARTTLLSEKSIEFKSGLLITPNAQGAFQATIGGCEN